MSAMNEKVIAMPRSKKPSYPLDALQVMEVVWHDAIEMGDIGWNNIKDIIKDANKPCPIMHTVGYVIVITDEHIAMLSTLGPQEGSKVEKIPRGWVVRETIMRAGETLMEYRERRRAERKERRGNVSEPQEEEE